MSGASSGTASHSGSAVTFTDTGGSSGGSFNYTLSDGTLTATGPVTVSEDTSGALDGDCRK